MIQIKYKSGEALRLRVQLYLRQDTSQVITHQIWSEHLQYLVVLMRYTYPVPLKKESDQGKSQTWDHFQIS